ncbi:MAG: PH domain-containing protein, partial [Oscillospiraceae bacterium]
MEFKRSHPINIFEHTSKYLALLIFPVLRALFLSGGSFREWFTGAWFDISVVSIILLFGWWGWYWYTYRVDSDGIYIKKGIFLRYKRFIPYTNISIVSVEYPFWLKSIKVARLTADTDGGWSKSSDFKITIKYTEVEPITSNFKKTIINPEAVKRVYLPKNFQIAILSFIASNSLAGVLFLSTFLSGTGSVLGKEFENGIVNKITSITQALSVGLPPIAGTLALVLLGGWLASFFVNLIRHLKLSAVRQSDGLHIKTGVISNYEHVVDIHRINLIEIRQTLSTKIFGIYSTFIHCNGYGKRKNELAVLMPAGRKKEVRKNLKLLLPEINLGTRKCKPHIRYLSRFLIPPLCWIGGVGVAWIIADYIFPNYSQIIFFFGLMIELPCIWFLFVKIASFLHTGIGVSEDVYTFSYTYAYNIKV